MVLLLRGFKMAKPELKAEAVRLRIEERLSLDAIGKKLGVSQGSCSLWLRDFPLTKEEIAERNSRPKRRNSDGFHPAKKVLGDASKHYRQIVDNNQKGRVAETAIAFRLALQGWEFYKAEGSKFDFVVNTGKLVTVQVKWTSARKYGLPTARLKRSNGRHSSRSYVEGDFDFLVAYNLYADTAYVFSMDEVIGKQETAIRPDAAERWDKLVQWKSFASEPER